MVSVIRMPYLIQLDFDVDIANAFLQRSWMVYFSPLQPIQPVAHQSKDMARRELEEEEQI